MSTTTRARKASRRHAVCPPVPERRRQHFHRVELNEHTKEIGLRGIAQAREVLRLLDAEQASMT